MWREQRKCYENENVFTEKVEEIISPVIATDPEGLYAPCSLEMSRMFWLT